MNAGGVAGELGILRRHHLDGLRYELVHRRAVRAEQSHVAHDATQDAAHDVARFFIGRRDTVADQHRRRPRMVGDNAKAHIVFGVRTVVLAAQFGGAIEDRPGAVNLVKVVDALQDRGHPFKAHTGVDVLGRKLAEDRKTLLVTACAAFELHEHEVPDFEITLFVRDGAAAHTESRAAVVVDLAARPARTWHSHRPEVVGHAAPLNALSRDADHVMPDRGRLVVVLVDSRPQQFGIEAIAAGLNRTRQQLPGERDCPLFEVVAEREVAAHLEERCVPGRLADLVDVGGANDLLHTGRAWPWRRQVAAEIGLEGLHAGNHE